MIRREAPGVGLTGIAPYDPASVETRTVQTRLSGCLLSAVREWRQVPDTSS